MGALYILMHGDYCTNSNDLYRRIVIAESLPNPKQAQITHNAGSKEGPHQKNGQSSVNAEHKWCSCGVCAKTQKIEHSHYKVKWRREGCRLLNKKPTAAEKDCDSL